MALTVNGEKVNTEPFKYYKPLKNIFVDSEGNLRDPEVPRARGSILLPEVISAHPDLNDMAGRYNIASNDAITVANGRPVNMHLRKSVDEGAKKYAARAQEHPYLHMAEVAAGAIPLAIAAAPAVVGGGELAATTLANPYVDAAITSAFAGHGLNHAINEGIDGWEDAAMTALELAPLGRLTKPVYEGVVQPGMRLFNSPVTGNWTKIGNREYRLSPNSFGANGSPIESRGIAPQITAENAASITPEQWTAAQDAAIARGDMAEAKRLRDLHFRIYTPQNRIVDAEGNPVKMIHGSQSKFTKFRHKDSPYGTHGRGMYFGIAPESGTTNYGGKNGYKYLTYLNGKSIYPDTGIIVRDNAKKVIPNDIMYEIIGTDSYDEFINSVTNQFKDKFEKYNQFYDLKNIEKNIDKKLYQKLHDSFDTKMSGVHNIHKKKHWFKKDEKYATFNPERAGEIVVRDPNQIKLADAITYDDNGVRIPLGMRDNFKINDIRYYESPNREAMKGIKYIEQTPSATSLDAEQQLVQRLKSYTPKVGENGLVGYKPLNSGDVVNIPEEAIERQIQKFVDSGMERENAIEYLREQFGYGAMTQNGKTFLLPEKYMITNPEYMKAHDAIHRVLIFDDSFNIPGAEGLNPNEAVAMISGEIKPALGIRANEPLTEEMLDKWLKTTNEKITGRYGFSSKIKDKKKFLKWANITAPAILPFGIGLTGYGLSQGSE